jgi:hypothetical protein
MSIVSAIRNFKSTLVQSAPIATARHVWRTFKSRLSNIPSQPLASRNVQAGQMTRQAKKPVLGSNPEMRAKFDAARDGNIIQVIDFLDWVKKQVPRDRQRREDLFVAAVRKELMTQCLDPEELSAIVKKAEEFEFNDRRGELILKAMNDVAQEMNDIKGTIDDIVSDIEGQLGKERKGNDEKFMALIPSALEARGLTGKELKDFVDKAASVVRSLKGRPETVLRIMHYRAQ